MSKNHLFPVHLTISILFGIWFVVFTINDILSVGDSYFWLICYPCPFSVAGLLAISSLIFLRPDNQSKFKYLPLAVNVITIITGVVLFSFADLNKDFGFRWHYQEYAEAVELIEAGKLQVYPENYVILPEQYQHLSIFGEASFSESSEAKSIYFMYDFENLCPVRKQVELCSLAQGARLKPSRSEGKALRAKLALGLRSFSPTALASDTDRKAMLCNILANTTDFENLDDFSWGYLYRSDGSEPGKEDTCKIWREIEPPVSHWYYCEANRIYWKQGG